jgi:hypothetical protein
MPFSPTGYGPHIDRSQERSVARLSRRTFHCCVRCHPLRAVVGFAAMSGTRLTPQRLDFMREVPTLGAPGTSAFQPPSPALASGHKCPTPPPAKRKGRFWAGQGRCSATPSVRDNQSASGRRPSSGRTPFRAPLRGGSMAAASISLPGIGPTIAVPRRYPLKP